MTAGPITIPADRAALGATAPWRRLTVQGVSLAIGESGTTGLPLVCLHAIGHGGGDFTALRTRFGSRHRVIAVDWPGQGRSAPDSEPPTARRYAGLLEGVLDGLQVERAVLIGNSIGGAAAIRFAADHPARVAGLVLSNPGGLDAPDAVSRAAIAGMVRFFQAGASGARWFPRAFACYYHLVLQRGAARDQRRKIVATAGNAAALLAQAWAGFAGVDQDLRAVIRRVQCPILFAWAARDQLVQLRRSLETIRALPNAQLIRLPAGHAPQLETPEAFAGAVETFLAERVVSAWSEAASGRPA